MEANCKHKKMQKGGRGGRLTATTFHPVSSTLLPLVSIFSFIFFRQCYFCSTKKNYPSLLPSSSRAQAQAQTSTPAVVYNPGCESPSTKRRRHALRQSRGKDMQTAGQMYIGKYSAYYAVQSYQERQVSPKSFVFFKKKNSLRVK